MNPGNTSNYPLSSLYVGDLHPDVNESMLHEKFAAVGPVLSIILCRDAVTRRSLGYAYINYERRSDAEVALDTLNYDVLKGRAIRIMWSQRDPSLRKSGIGNVFVSNLDETVDSNILHDNFSIFGCILSCKVVLNDSGKSKGYGFVHFETKEMAKRAIDKANGMLLNGKNISVRKFTPRNKRGRGIRGRSYGYNYFVHNLSDDNSPSGGEPLICMRPAIGMGGIPPSDFMMAGDYRGAQDYGIGVLDSMWDVEYGGVGPTNDCAADGPVSPVSSGSDTDSCYCY